MKSEKELSDIAGAIGAMFATHNCTSAEVMVILNLLHFDVYEQMFDAGKKQREVHKVKIE